MDLLSERPKNRREKMGRSGTRPDRMQSKESVVQQPGILGDETTSEDKEEQQHNIHHPLEMATRPGALFDPRGGVSGGSRNNPISWRRLDIARCVDTAKHTWQDLSQDTISVDRSWSCGHDPCLRHSSRLKSFL